MLNQTLILSASLTVPLMVAAYPANSASFDQNTASFDVQQAHLNNSNTPTGVLMHRGSGRCTGVPCR